MIKKVRLTTDVFPYGKAGDIIEGHYYNSSIFIPCVLPFEGILYAEEYKEE